MYRIPQRQLRPRRPNHRQKARVEKQRRERDEKREERRIEAEQRLLEAERRRELRRELRRGRPSPDEITLAATSAERYAERRAAFLAAFGDVGWWLHLAAWLAHNCVAHPLLGLAPGRWAVDLHDRTSDWLNLRRAESHSPVPDVGVRWAWLVHNCLAHPLIGLFPQERWFSFHDETAERMDVEGWL